MGVCALNVGVQSRCFVSHISCIGVCLQMSVPGGAEREKGGIVVVVVEGDIVASVMERKEERGNGFDDGYEVQEADVSIYTGEGTRDVDYRYQGSLKGTSSEGPTSSSLVHSWTTRGYYASRLSVRQAMLLVS